MTRRPRFITFEGGEGGGKSTQIRRLAAALRARGHAVTVTREPGGTPDAEAIRALLVRGDVGRWDPLAETLLHIAARRQHVARLIRPALDRGEFVLSDRFADSTVAYQGGAQGVGRQTVDALHTLALEGLVPGLTLVLDLPPDEGLARAEARGGTGRYERWPLARHQAVRATFLAIAAADAERCRVIDATQSTDAVADAVRRAVVARFGEPAR